jgi:phosphoglycerol transferase MdoB-like AlkP superfamily enzyme
MRLLIKNSTTFLHVKRLVVSSLITLLSFSLIMSMVRLFIFVSHNTKSVENYSDLLSALWLGFRLDGSILAYIMALSLLYLLVLWILRASKIIENSYVVFRYYLFIMLSIVSFMLIADIAYFSFFSEHITLMIFGIIDDDTAALFEIAKKNYNLTLIASALIIYLVGMYRFISYIFKKRPDLSSKTTPFLKQVGFFITLISLTTLIGRGSIGIFPLAKDIADVSDDPLINKLAKNGVYAMVDAYEQYTKSKDGSYDLIKMSGYKADIQEAFSLHVRHKIDRENLIKNLVKTTPKNETLEKNPPHVVVIMLESFGLPILKYQSEEFDILRRLKKHFDEDTLFTNFISSSNGTIVSLEPLLLNITARPQSTSFAQSRYLNTSFKQASARVYEDAGYETSFVYGGDLSWRNVGSFMGRQGFKNTYGKAAISKALHVNKKEAYHEWGIYDKYTYDFVYEKLKNAKKPQFIFVLTTNNHPPYTISKEYNSKELHFSKELSEHISGDKTLAKERFQDYQYALDMAGKFLDKIKNSSLVKNTLVAITGDNNTVEGIMHYDNYYDETKKIPFYLYLPDSLHVKDINTSIAGSHKDIFPTLYNLTLSNRSYISIGENLLDYNALHCGFNDAGVLMANDGGFKVSKAKTALQKECDKYYKASLAVTEYLIKNQTKASKLTN